MRKTCGYNSFTFNKKGDFAGSYNKKADNFKYEKERIIKFYESLNSEFVHIKNGSYEEIEDMLQKRDFIYLDPPYYSGRDTMIDYSSSLDSKEGQIKIRDFLLKIHEKGVLFMFSNYTHSFIMNLYSDKNIFNIETVMVVRNIRGKKYKEEEVIITNY